MKRLLITASLAAVVTGVPAKDTLADHLHPHHEIRRTYNLERKELDRQYYAQKKALENAYHRERDLIHAERARVASRGYGTGARLRALSRDLTDLSREFSSKKRELSRVHRAHRDALRHDYQLALHKANGFAAYRQLRDPIYGHHPAGCGCSSCSRKQVLHDHHRHGHRGAEFDWAGLVVNLLRNRLAR